MESTYDKYLVDVNTGAFFFRRPSILGQDGRRRAMFWLQEEDSGDDLHWPLLPGSCDLDHLGHLKRGEGGKGRRGGEGGK